MARGKHLFPFRTEQLSPSAPMVLGPQGPGRVGRRRLYVGTGRPSGGPFCVLGRSRRRVRRGRGTLAPCRRHAWSCARSPRRTSWRWRSSTRRPEIRAAIDPFGEHVPEEPSAALRVRAPARRPAGLPRGGRAPDRRVLVGLVSVRGVRWPSGRARARLPAAPGRWGEGYATEGAAALLRDAFARPGIARVYAHSLLDNPGSIRVMEKIGMTYAGPWSYRGLPGAEYEALAPSAPSGP